MNQMSQQWVRKCLWFCFGGNYHFIDCYYCRSAFIVVVVVVSVVLIIIIIIVVVVVVIIVVIIVIIIIIIIMIIIIIIIIIIVTFSNLTVCDIKRQDINVKSLWVVVFRFHSGLFFSNFRRR